MNGSSTEPPTDSGEPGEPSQTKDAPYDAARELEWRHRAPGDRTSEEQPDSSAYRIERQAILLRRRRWVEAGAVDAGPERARPRAAPVQPPDLRDPAGLWQYERPQSKPQSDSGLGGWLRTMWRRLTP